MTTASLLPESCTTLLRREKTCSPRQRRGGLVASLAWAALSLPVVVAAPRAHAQAGSLDLSFNPGAGADAEVFYVSARPNGGILVSGDFFFFNNQVTPGLTRLNPDGSLDPDFSTGTGPDFFISAVAVAPDEKIIVGGDFTLFNEQPRLSFARLNPDGSLDRFGGLRRQGTNGRVSAVAVQPDGKVIIGGEFTQVNNERFDRLARLKTADGAIDGQFKRVRERFGFFVTPISRIVVQPDGKVLLAGLFATTEPFARDGFKIARVNDRNRVDLDFDPGQGAAGINGVVNDIALQPDGKILIGGTFRTVRNQVVGGIARLNPDGSLDDTFGPGPGQNGFDQAVNAIALQPDGKILVGGFFGFHNGVSRNGIARLNPDGSLDLTFNPGSGANAEVNAISIQADGKIVIGGDFFSFNGVPRQRVARLNGD